MIGKGKSSFHRTCEFIALPLQFHASAWNLNYLSPFFSDLLIKISSDLRKFNSDHTSVLFQIIFLKTFQGFYLFWFNFARGSLLQLERRVREEHGMHIYGLYKLFFKVPPAGDESDIELDPISEEARQTDAVIERLAETSTERDSPEQGGSSSIRSGKRIMETSLGKEAFENTGKGSHSGKRFAETGVGNGLPESSSSRNGKPGCEPHVVANNNVSPFVGGVNFVGSVSTKHNIRHMDSLGDSADNNSL